MNAGSPSFRRGVRASTLLVGLWVAACSLPGGDPEPGPSPVPPDTLRVLAYNIHHGEGMDDVIDLQRIADLIRRVDPDVVTVQEVDSVADRTGRTNQAAELGRLTGMTPVFGRFMAYQGGAYGMAILSRWRIRDVVNHRLPDGEEPRSALTVVVTSPTTGRAVRLVGIHFYRTEDERAAQADTLEALLDAGPDGELPTILAGDFNSEPGSRVIRELSRRWSVVDKGADALTFSSFDPVREIDFVMYRPHDRFEVLGERLLDEPVISDHRPVVVDLLVR
ncbi:MAG TPA: endonuclease/exonuclease/phosphatase family protein [Longimicrobiales bacterium]|nr:endonuclease/exonuclease/phosphatase family protein [Longimicrobiales bacterium]